MELSNGNTLYICSTVTGPGTRSARMPVVLVSEKSVWMPRRSHIALAIRLPRAESHPDELEVGQAVDLRRIRLEQRADDGVLGHALVHGEQRVVRGQHLEAVDRVVASALLGIVVAGRRQVFGVDGQHEIEPTDVLGERA